MFKAGISFILSLTIAFPPGVWAHESPRFPVPNLSPAPLDLAEQWLKAELLTQSGQPTDRLALDTFSLQPQRVYPLDPDPNKKALIGWSKISVVLRSSDQPQIAQTIHLAAHEQVRREATACSGHDTCTLELWTTARNGQLKAKVNEIMRPIESLAVVGPYVLMVMKGHFDASEEKATLTYMDLRQYQTSLANDRIPLFEIPLHMTEPIQLLTAEDDHLLINGKLVLATEQLRAISSIYGAAFNFTANSLNPKTMAGALTLYSGIDRFMAREMDALGANQTGEDNAETATIKRDALVEKVRAEVDARKKNAVEKSRDNATTALARLKGDVDSLDEEGRALTARFEHYLNESGEIEKSIVATQRNLRLGRKLTSRIRTWEGFVTKRSVNPGVTIARGLQQLALYWTQGAMDVGTLIARATSLKPGARVTSPSLFFLASLLGAWQLSGVMPDSFYQFEASALSMGGQTAAYVGRVLYGFFDATRTSASQIGEVATHTGSTVYSQYINVEKGNWYKTLIGLSVWTSALAGGLGAWHIINRTRDLVRDMRKPDYAGFVARQQAIEKEYAQEIAAGEQKKRLSLADRSTFTADEEVETLGRLRAIKKQRVEEANNHWTRRLSPIRFLQSLVGSNKTAAQAMADEINEDCKEASAPCEQAAGQISAAAETDAAGTISSMSALQTGTSDLLADEKSIQTRFQAFRHFLIGTASYRYTVGEYTAGFNAYASYRYSMFGWYSIPLMGDWMKRKFGQQIPLLIYPKPFSIGTRFVFPNFFKTAVSQAENQIVMPTVLNGGMTSAWTKYWRWSERVLRRSQKDTLEVADKEIDDFAAEEDPQASSNLVMGHLDGMLSEQTPEEINRDLAASDEFEEKIIKVENLVLGETTQAAMKEFAGFVKDDEELRRIFTVSDGFATVTSANISMMTMRNKTFVRTYSDLVYQETMRRLLTRTIDDHKDRVVNGILVKAERDFGTHSDAMDRLNEVAAAPTTEDQTPEETTFVTTRELKDLKEMILKANPSSGPPIEVTYDPDTIVKIVREVTADPKFAAKAKAEATRIIPRLETLKRHLRYEVATNYDPEQNKSMKRYDIVARQRKDPIAMARATRNEISTLFRTLPVDIASKFILLAGVSEVLNPLNKPIQEYFFGPNSIAYFSQNEFYGSLLMGILFSSVSSAWGKLQSDYENAEQGLFGDIPQGEDAKKGFWSWFVKKWNAPENSFWNNYKQYGKIIFWNLPAAIPQIFLLNMLFLNRFDLEGFLMGYLSTFLIPLSVLMFKVDQVYEQANYYGARGFTEKDVTHPAVQEYLQAELQKDRNSFDMKKAIAFAPINEIFGNLFVTGTALMGPYALWRSILNGYTPTELIAYKLKAGQKFFSTTPVAKVVDTLASACEKILTNGNINLTKLPK